MSDLDFEVLGAEPDRYAADPMLVFMLRVKENEGEVIQSVSLRCQIMIEPQRRRYTRDEESRLLAMFGEPSRWGSTVKPFLWTHTSTIVPGFTGSIDFKLQVPCTYDFEIASSKYMHAVETGEVPLNLLFSGIVFAEAENGFKAEPIAWNKEARYGLPGTTWRSMMDFFFPGTGWIRIPRNTLDRLERFKTVKGLPTWDQAFELLLKEAEATDAEGAEKSAGEEPPDPMAALAEERKRLMQ
jgi:hypothetical protein